MDDEKRPKDAFLSTGALVALIAAIPFARILLAGQSLFFRDLSVAIFPARRFVIEGLQKGEWRFWNPFVHEGAPLALPPYSYLPDLLQLLMPDEVGFSFLLALHLPFAAVSFALLARHLELPPVSAATGAFVYALGGFSMSTINLYFYTQAMAWAPLFILAFRRAVLGGRARSLALAGLALAMMISTAGLEIAILACLAAVVLAPPTTGLRFARSAGSALLGLALCAAVILPMLAAAGATERGSGFPTWVVLSNSVHPMTFLQVLIPGLYGDISNLSGTWWGTRFFSNGFPYFLSLYLGPTVLALAWAGATCSGRPLRRRLIGLVVLGVIVSLGRYAGFEAVLNLSPALRFLRYPTKAFFVVEFSIALLAAIAISEVAAGNQAVVRRVARTGLALGGILTSTLLIPVLAPSASFLSAFVPEGLSPLQQQLIARLIAGDASKAGLVCLCACGVALMAARERIPPGPAALALAALVGADLVRCGAGLNASVTPDFYRLSPEMASVVGPLREAGGRVFTCDPEASPSYWEGRHARGANHEAFSMAVLRESFTPDFNLALGIRTALSIDRTGLTAPSRTLSPELATCQDFARIAPALRAAGVNRVVSLDPLNQAGLTLLAEVSPPSIAPVTLRIYELEGARPRFDPGARVVSDETDHLSLEVTMEQAGSLTILDPYAPGWRATVNGVARPVLRTTDGHRELPLDQGRNDVRMSYEPPGLKLGLGISGLSALFCLGLLVRRDGGPPPKGPRERLG